jgi:hypothetical protein
MGDPFEHRLAIRGPAELRDVEQHEYAVHGGRLDLNKTPCGALPSFPATSKAS